MVGALAEPGVDELLHVGAEEVRAPLLRGVAAVARATTSGSVISATRPAISASPRQPDGSAERLRTAKRGSRRTSSAFHGLPHAPEPELAVGEGWLGPVDPRRAVLPERGERLVRERVELTARHRELRRLRLDVRPPAATGQA